MEHYTYIIGNYVVVDFTLVVMTLMTLIRRPV